MRHLASRKDSAGRILCLVETNRAVSAKEILEIYTAKQGLKKLVTNETGHYGSALCLDDYTEGFTEHCVELFLGNPDDVIKIN